MCRVDLTKISTSRLVTIRRKLTDEYHQGIYETKPLPSPPDLCGSRKIFLLRLPFPLYSDHLTKEGLRQTSARHTRGLLELQDVRFSA